MNAETKKWIDKAEGDFEGASTLIRKRSPRLPHLTCFACQQSAEKYLKAYLVERNVRFSKTHDLTKQLLPLRLKVDPEFKSIARFLETLDPYAVEFRYPGETIRRSSLRKAYQAAEAVRRFVRAKLGLERQRSLL
jgi:HEPN domain-containing protein